MLGERGEEREEGERERVHNIIDTRGYMSLISMIVYSTSLEQALHNVWCLL